jgi:hypothetical protein
VEKLIPGARVAKAYASQADDALSQNCENFSKPANISRAQGRWRTLAAARLGSEMSISKRAKEVRKTGSMTVAPSEC